VKFKPKAPLDTSQVQDRRGSRKKIAIDKAKRQNRIMEEERARKVDKNEFGISYAGVDQETVDRYERAKRAEVDRRLDDVRERRAKRAMPKTAAAKKRGG
jgi:hypothetical protein